MSDEGSPTKWLRWLAGWAVVLASGVFVGLLLAGSILWWQAILRVRAYVAEPARTAPGVIWSAPIEVREGQTTTLPELAGDLLAAGYSRLEPFPDDPRGASRVGVFSVDDATLRIWTETMVGPDFHVPAGLAEITFADGRVKTIGDGDEETDEDEILLRPTVLATIGDPAERRGEVEVDYLSPWVERAIVAIEDERFREHLGVDPYGIARALQENVEAGETVEGGSTLTQQLAKNLFLTPERTLRRKVREALLALALEAHLTKDEILELYLGEVYLGQMGGLPLYGLGAASRAWFGKSPEFLELHEAALLAGVIAAPNRYSPVRHPEVAQQRRDLVLDRMVELDLATPAEVAEAKAAELEPVGLEPSMVRRAPYAVDHAVDVAERELGHGALASRGYQVWTWIQPQLQRTAEQAVRDGVAEVERMRPAAEGAQAALVAVRNTDGGIVAMVGGRSYLESPFNRAVDARRQAGSTIKPLTLLAALDGRDVTLADTLLDAPIVRGSGRDVWRPRNYDGGYAGPMTVREAVVHSRNIPAVLLSEKVGLPRLKTHLESLGLTGATGYPSMALGGFGVTPVEMAGAYTVFPNGGVAQEPHVVRAITTADGQMIRRFGSAPHRVADADATALAVSVLEDVMERGTAARSRTYGITGPVGGKTGTTDAFRDAWFVGFTPELSVAVWVGLDRKDALGLPGSRGALPTWSSFVARSGSLGHGSFPSPDGLVTATVCTTSGQLARPYCPSTRTETFARGTAPASHCDIHRPRPQRKRGFWDRIFGGDDRSDAEQRDRRRRDTQRPRDTDDRYEQLYPRPDDEGRRPEGRARDPRSPRLRTVPERDERERPRGDETAPARRSPSQERSDAPDRRDTDTRQRETEGRQREAEGRQRDAEGRQREAERRQREVERRDRSEAPERDEAAERPRREVRPEPRPREEPAPEPARPKPEPEEEVPEPEPEPEPEEDEPPARMFGPIDGD